MNKQFAPYYISRAILSSILAILSMGFNWKALLLAALFFGFFLFYLHSGWFRIDSENTLLPLRRDSRGQLIQRKALIIAIIVGLITYFSLDQLSSWFGLDLISGSIAFAIAIVAYFTTQFVLFSKA
jgi:hypothetical protein